MLRIHISTKAETALRGGHPWLFSESIQKQNHDGAMGELSAIYDRKDVFLGIGLYDPESPLRVRMIYKGKPRVLDSSWWYEKIRATIQLRHQWFNDTQTTGFRYIHGENDGFPGLVLDRYGEGLVLKIYTAAWFEHLSEILPSIQKEINPLWVVLRLSRNVQAYFQRMGNKKWIDGSVIAGNLPEECVVFKENNILFEANVLRGQKTGFFLDQRENREWVKSFSVGRRMLNAFSFSGGFSLYAAQGGAVSVSDLDISAHALESAKKNFSLNSSDSKIKNCEHLTLQADAFEWLKTADSKYDLIVLDPPSLAKKEDERRRAIEAYGRLSFGAIRCLNEGGILVSASCSAHVSAEEFFEAVIDSAKKFKRTFKEIQRTQHPKDHPATFAEAKYLKAIYLSF
jgi:23S rRNA (cytosine1962-C5)-methyltransferase